MCDLVVPKWRGRVDGKVRKSSRRPFVLQLKFAFSEQSVFWDARISFWFETNLRLPVQFKNCPRLRVEKGTKNPDARDIKLVHRAHEELFFPADFGAVRFERSRRN